MKTKNFKSGIEIAESYGDYISGIKLSLTTNDLLYVSQLSHRSEHELLKIGSDHPTAETEGLTKMVEFMIKIAQANNVKSHEDFMDQFDSHAQRLAKEASSKDDATYSRLNKVEQVTNKM